ncbi:MBL fold metallo-hydrolase [Pontibacter sp. G13]|uniref:MBL fold metallo-hydrolase n=1 Tax=Pontibacter sp. G13 TaxID=3074898 RepID=UPI00288BF09F|nr:MBL fold metallo-hydrolase [Pontibacter sp. G13]WNJ17327.1 MBL fold metallo-hydrolase [Pontibacter sp. G13]
MTVEQLYTGCLAEAAYYIESNGEAAIIDPLRETQPYVERAKEDNAKIKYIFETHFHADFVSGHVDLAQKSGATIVYGPGADPAYEVHEAVDGETFQVGALTIKVLHTPGHTQESTSYLLLDEHGTPKYLFSGDTLFIGDVGRPDLAVKSDLSQEDLAGMLFDSLRQKIMTLPDEVVVYPGHGAGSACGKNMSKETFDTLGHQKEVNYALRADMTKEEFITEVTTGIMPPPQYFAKNAMMNKQGYQSFDDILERGSVALTPDLLESLVEHEGALVLDVRKPGEYAAGHIPKSIFIGLDGSFAPWVGALITDLKQPIVLVAPDGREEEAVTRLSRVGYDHTLGYLEGGIEAWKAAGKELDTVESIPATAFAEGVKTGDRKVIDVRKPSEYISEHVIGAENVPLDFINQKMGELDHEAPYYVHCAGGYRSMITISILKARGLHNLIDVQGGFKAIKETDVSVSDYVCPSTL